MSETANTPQLTSSPRVMQRIAASKRWRDLDIEICSVANAQIASTARSGLGVLNEIVWTRRTDQPDACF